MAETKIFSVITGSGAPTSSIPVSTVGTRYIDIDTNREYYCKSITQGLTPNYTTVGDVTVNYEYIASNFSNSRYINTNYSGVFTYPWYVKYKFKLSSLPTSFGRIISPYNDYKNFAVQIENGKILLAASSNGYSWNIIVTGTNSVSTNTYYWGIVGWTGTKYYISSSTDGETYTEEVYYNSTTPLMSSENMLIGECPSKSSQGTFPGEIDLKEFAFYSNNSLTYKAVLDTGVTWIPTIKSGNNINVSGNEIGLDLTDVSGYDASKTQILKHVNGTLTWVDAA